jgi:hypothetical protein
MERRTDSNAFYLALISKFSFISQYVAPLCEIPRDNGSKPAGILRVAEQCKKHIRRDGRK